MDAAQVSLGRHTRRVGEVVAHERRRRPMSFRRASSSCQARQCCTRRSGFHRAAELLPSARPQERRRHAERGASNYYSLRRVDSATPSAPWAPGRSPSSSSFYCDPSASHVRSRRCANLESTCTTRRRRAILGDAISACFKKAMAVFGRNGGCRRLEACPVGSARGSSSTQREGRTPAPNLRTPARRRREIDVASKFRRVPGCCRPTATPTVLRAAAEALEHIQTQSEQLKLVERRAGAPAARRRRYRGRRCGVADEHLKRESFGRLAHPKAVHGRLHVCHRREIRSREIGASQRRCRAFAPRSSTRSNVMRAPSRHSGAAGWRARPFVKLAASRRTDGTRDGQTV